MRRSVKFASCVLVCALVVALVPAGAPAQSRFATPPVQVKIALAAPLSEGATALGQGMGRGMDLAIEDYSAELASAGVQVGGPHYDDQGDPMDAVAAANSIAADPLILGVVGHLNSGCSIPASQIYDTVHVAMISPASTNPALTQQGLDNVFRDVATDAVQGGFAAETVARNLRLTRAYVVDDSTPYGEGLGTSFGYRLKKLGGKVIGSAKTSDRDTDFSALVKRIRKKNPQVVYYGGIYNAGALFEHQLKSSMPGVQFVGGDGLYDPQFILLAGSSKASGTLATSVGLDLDKMPGAATFSAHYAAAFPGQGIAAYDPYAYDAAATLLRAIIAVANESGPSALLGGDARELVRAKVAAADFTGVTGRVAFNSVGDTLNPAMSVYRVKSGGWRETATIGKPQVASSGKRNTGLAVSGGISPTKGLAASSVTLLFYRKSGSKYVLAKSLKAKVGATYSGSAKLPKAGTYFVIARQQDAKHGSMDSVQTFFKLK